MYNTKTFKVTDGNKTVIVVAATKWQAMDLAVTQKGFNRSSIKIVRK